MPPGKALLEVSKHMLFYMHSGLTSDCIHRSFLDAPASSMPGRKRLIALWVGTQVALKHSTNPTIPRIIIMPRKRPRRRTSPAPQMGDSLAILSTSFRHLSGLQALVNLVMDARPSSPSHMNPAAICFSIELQGFIPLLDPAVSEALAMSDLTLYQGRQVSLD
jgi:hypothetical protein